MEKEFIPYDMALKLKGLGFDEPCIGFWKSNIKYQRFIADYGCNRDLGGMFGRDAKLIPTAPTFSQAFRWFREEHNIDGEVYLILVAHNGIDKEQQLSDKEYSFKVIINGIPEFISIEDIYSSYEEAELACLEKLLEIIEKK